MRARAEVEQALQVVDRLVDDAVRRAANLERAIGVMLAVGGNTAPADKALMATYNALGVYSRRRERLMTILVHYDDRDQPA